MGISRHLVGQYRYDLDRDTLAHDATLRASLVAMAEVKAKEALPQNAEQAMDRIKQMSIETEKFGLALTAVAVSLDAHFWFDVLNKLINICSVGKRPERSHQEKDPASK